VSVSVIVEELKGEPFNPVLIYKPQGTKDPQYLMLPDDTFILALQTKFQKELYEVHASTILCIDSTHGTNQYRFKLITCIVPDDYGKGTYVCRLCITSKTQQKYKAYYICIYILLC